MFDLGLDSLMCVCLQEFLISEDFNKMNHVKTYPGEEARRVEKQTAVRPDCWVLATFSFITVGNGVLH